LVPENAYKWGLVPQLMDFLGGIKTLDECHVKSMNDKIFGTPVEAILSENLGVQGKLCGIDEQGSLYTKDKML